MAWARFFQHWKSAQLLSQAQLPLVTYLSHWLWDRLKLFEKPGPGALIKLIKLCHNSVQHFKVGHFPFVFYSLLVCCFFLGIFRNNFYLSSLQARRDFRGRVSDHPPLPRFPPKVATETMKRSSFWGPAPPPLQTWRGTDFRGNFCPPPNISDEI